jgi:hypothetical protein
LLASRRLNGLEACEVASKSTYNAAAVQSDVTNIALDSRWKSVPFCCPHADGDLIIEACQPSPKRA